MSHSQPQHYAFVQHPQAYDYVKIAEHLENDTASEGVHISLKAQRTSVAQSLRVMSCDPERGKHQSAYHALRLFVP